MRAGMIALALVTLAACNQSEMAQDAPSGLASAPAEAPAPPPPGGPAQAARGGEEFASDIQIETEERKGATPQQSGQPGDPISYLAYSYAIGMQLPGEQVIPLMGAHEKACRDAGPRLCQLIGSTRSGDPQSYLSGSISLRGEPAWLQRFMGGLEGQARDAGGKIASESISTEDLTRAIIDTEATLRAKTALRERIQALLRSHPGKLSDILEAERELARVQGEIDSITSNLAAMRTRVSMSALTLSYESKPRSVAGDTFEPLTQAFASFLSVIVQGFAAIVLIVAGVLPFAIVFGLIAWLLIWIRNKRGGRFLRARAMPPAETN